MKIRLPRPLRSRELRRRVSFAARVVEDLRAAGVPVLDYHIGGSTARGDFGFSSDLDLDLLVPMAKEETAWAYYRRLRKAWWRDGAGYFVDVCFWTPRDIAKSRQYWPDAWRFFRGMFPRYYPSWLVADLDGTILERWAPGNYTPRPGPALRLVQEAYKIAILTNQGGLALQWAGVPGAERYPNLRATLTRVRAGMEWSGARLALVVAVHPRQAETARGRVLSGVGQWLPPVLVDRGIYLSFNPGFRKPAPGGVRWLCARLGVGPDSVTFVGDADDDRDAAGAAGVCYLDVADLGKPV